MRSKSCWIRGLALMACLPAAGLAFADPARRDAAAAQAAREEEQAQKQAERDQRQREQAKRHSERAQREGERVEALYERGTAALDDNRWDQAIESFGKVAAAGGRRADGALYWKAYAQHRRGQPAEALATLSELRRGHPSSRWSGEAQALELEIKQASGQNPSPEAQPDEELKLLAISGLMQSHEDRALPLLLEILEGRQPPRIKDRALFVLSQSESPRARDLLARIARGESNPDLQLKAVRYLGLQGAPRSLELLGEVYAASTDATLKRTILRAFMMAGERRRLLTAAREETSEDLRLEAIQQLGVMGALDELQQLLQSETSTQAKQRILQGFGISGASKPLIAAARSEQDPELRRAAIHALGLLDSSEASEALVSLYASEKDGALRRQAIQSLFVQGNAAALVEIARREQDPGLRLEVVTHLSHMDSKEASDFLLELLKK